MKILLVKDDNINIDLEKCTKLLNNICNTIKFTNLNYNLNYAKDKSYIEYYDEVVIINKSINNKNIDYILYITNRKYKNNYYYYFNQYIMILSIYGWEYYTNLPIENGLFYFIADMIALTFPINNRHDATTGCIYDYKYDKTSVDDGMRQGYICDECLQYLLPVLESSTKLKQIYTDLIKILNIISNASKWNKNVLYEEKIESEIKYDWSSYENEIADIYRELGAQVKQNINLSGFQIDILLEEETPSKQTIRSIIECKYHKDKIGVRTVNDFYRRFITIKEVSNIDKAIMVSYSGYSQEAQSLAQSIEIELLNYKDLKHKLKNKYKYKTSDIEAKFVVKKDTIVEIEKYPDVLTIMPYSEDLDDIYYLGIHDTVKKCGYTCARIDEMEYVGGIIEKIYDSIKNAKIIIAELTNTNPNVYYELGYAHALEKTVIPITKDVSNAPFDVRQFNHITYTNIRDLREKLYKRINAFL